LEVFFITIYLFILKKIFDSEKWGFLKFAQFAHIFILLLGSIVLFFLRDYIDPISSGGNSFSGLVPFMEDQAGYLVYTTQPYSQWDWSQHYIKISWLISNFSIFDPVFSLRLFNFLLHLGVVFFAYKTLELFELKTQSLRIAGYIIAFMPSFLFFDFNIMRDMLIIFSFSASIWALASINYRGISIVNVAVIIFFLLLIFQMKPGVILPLLLILLSYVTGNKIGTLVFILALMIISIFSVNFRLDILFSEGMRILQMLLNKFTISEIFIGLIKGLFSINFIYMSHELLPHLIKRLVIFDSLLVPILYFLAILRLNKSEYKFFLGAIFFGYVGFILLYLGLEPDYSISYRVQLPFVYSAVLTVIVVFEKKIAFLHNKFAKGFIC